MSTSSRLALLFTAATLASGCSALYTRAPLNGVTNTTFDDRFHDGLQEVWDTCSEPLDLEPGDTDIDLLNGCGLADTLTAEGDTVLLMLGTFSPVPLADAVPSEVFAQSSTVEVNAWPMQNCEIDFDVTADLNRLRLLNQETSWETHDSEPSIHIDYDFPAAAHVVDVTIDADVRCPSGLNEAALQASLNALLPNGPIQVDLTGLDLDIYVELENTSTAITGDLDLDIDVGGIDIDAFVVDVANLIGVSDETLLASFGLTLAGLENEIEPLLEDSLADLPDAVSDALMAAVPAGHEICDVKIVNGDDLRLVTDAPSGFTTCMVIIPHGL